ncbi:MAG: bifunctional aspartate kinase/homoserine dehydrogenase I [Treponemataceae bacterium]
MITLKFGGTSMANAQRMISASDIMETRLKNGKISVVVSAVAGVSNFLQESINEAIKNTDIELSINKIIHIHHDICTDIEKNLPPFNTKKTCEKLQQHFDEYAKLLHAVNTFGECPLSIHCRIMGLGELLSSIIMEEILLAKKLNVVLLDSREFIYTSGNQAEGDPLYEKTENSFLPYRDEKGSTQFDVLLFSGFICSWVSPDNSVHMGLLGRNGSDFSAAIIASALNAKKIEIWTDVDGIFSADPRIVKDAILVDKMTYEEAMELSFFGSKVLHPKTLSPLIAKNIETWSLNSYNINAPGTLIGKGPFETQGHHVRGISCLKNTAMISVLGSGLKGKKGIAARIFQAVSRAGISLLLITQSSSEYTISFCVSQNDARLCKDALSTEFELEIKTGIILPIAIEEHTAIVSIVGDGMKERRGVAGRFFNALAASDINLHAIAQGSSERSISCVIKGSDGDTAVRSAHRFFFDTNQTIEVFLLGVGTIGRSLLDQIKTQQEKLLNQKIKIKVVGIANSTKILLKEEGIAIENWQKELQEDAQNSTIDNIIAFVKKTKPFNPVFVDCTASKELPKYYLDIFKAGMHICTANKVANSLKMDYYSKLRTVANDMNRRFLYETNVGAGLPVIDTLQNQLKTGDCLVRFLGIMSGSLSYIFGRLDDGVSFSTAVLEARAKGFTEPDPRDDLSGLDVARKLLIIARQSGMSIELADITVHNIFPSDFDTSGTTEDFLKKIDSLDTYFENKIQKLKTEKKVLRMVGSIENGKCEVGCIKVSSEDALYTIKGGENAFVFFTDRYSPTPLTIRGYGAGANVTAAGVFSDILRTVSWNP